MKRPVSYGLLILLFLAWALPGLVGRDLWKADEPYSFGLTYHIIRTGDAVVPTLAGEPFLEKPPLYYLTAAASSRFFSIWLSPHDAARLINIPYLALILLCVGLAARELTGPGRAGIAALMLLGAVGLQITAHKLITDVALLAGFALALYGLALSRRRPALGGVWLGTGVGIGFLSKGLLAPGVIGIAALALPLFFAEWRRKSYYRSLGISVIAALPWLIVWPAALYFRSPALFTEWFYHQNMGRFFGFGHPEKKNVPGAYFVTLLWYALPVLPFALRALWTGRRSWSNEPAIQLPLTMCLSLFLVISTAATGRDLYALPMLLPLTLLAATGVPSLHDRTARLLNRLSIAVFGVGGGMLWLGWVAVETGHSADIARLLLLPGAETVFAANRLSLTVAIAVTVLWLYAVVRFLRSGAHPVAAWSAGMVLTWGLVMTLWLPWIDAGSGFRPVMTSLRGALPARHEAVASLGLGESERALVEYYAGIQTRRLEVAPLGDAELLLVKSAGQDLLPPKAWRKLWQGARPGLDGSPKESFQLFKRTGAASVAAEQAFLSGNRTTTRLSD